jgi:hypothetical protein
MMVANMQAGVLLQGCASTGDSEERHHENKPSEAKSLGSLQFLTGA